jgi:hypothetical protein
MAATLLLACDRDTVDLVAPHVANKLRRCACRVAVASLWSRLSVLKYAVLKSAVPRCMLRLKSRRMLRVFGVDPPLLAVLHCTAVKRSGYVCQHCLPKYLSINSEDISNTTYDCFLYPVMIYKHRVIHSSGIILKEVSEEVG